MIRFCAAIAGLVCLGACAFGDATLQLGYDVEAATPGVLSEAESQKLYVAEVKDERVDPERIGYKTNGYGQRTASVLSERSAPEIVKEALETVVLTNGHELGVAEDRYALETTLTNFWFETKTGFWTVEFQGSVQADVALVDSETGSQMFKESFDGFHSARQAGGLSGTWERIMNAALADMVQKVNLSPGLMEALSSMAEETPVPPADATEAPVIGADADIEVTEVSS